ncbi:E3 ubiquitin-protein ligase pellino homolog 3 isoform X1 [Chelonia mydas]|uniref:E3 ubiquitin-protein ligase pellino homolog 3 isoform X1 n=1 Tax=Chelonia mydas TaxID=8469 RepID=UPI001CA8BF5D|nr:E3 ubiquitin-protein ligase pellino homolog 3 isoform X1 [Chelonia mydas]XP_043407657.1 E3 ubiquitin-protein ligase pellino homolog 3 isoform X1 [Chelonia mydas]
MVLEGSPEAVSSQSLDLRRSCPKGSRIFPSAGEGSLLNKEAVKYGELIVLGYNGSLASGDKGRRRSRIALFKRPKANGVKPDVIHHISTPLVSKALSNKGQHSISYTLSRSHSVIVEYTHDCDTDMFQIGRSTENMIDFVVTDTAPGGSCASEGQSAQSTISRYACRIICERSPPYTARIYAAGFDSSRNIFLGERAAKWRTPDGLMDGLTTNGVLVMHPTGGFSEDSAPGVWREISVCGNVYALRDSRSAQQRGKLPQPPSLGTDALTRPAPRLRLPCPAGADRVQRVAGRLAHRPVRGHAAVADHSGAAADTHPQAAGGAAPGDECRPPPVPCGLQHAGLPQPGPARRGGQTAALGLCQLRPRPRLPQLGLPQGEGGAGAGVPHVPSSRTLRAALAGLRGWVVPGHRPAHPRLLPLRPRLFPEDCAVLGPDPAAPRHPCLPCRLPLLWHLAHRRAGICAPYLPGPHGLSPGTQQGDMD